MTIATCLSAVGLLLDIGGAILLWLYVLPPDVRRGGGGALLLESSDPAEAEKAERYDRRARIGIGLLVLGFMLQLAGTLTGASG